VPCEFFAGTDSLEIIVFESDADRSTAEAPSGNPHADHAIETIFEVDRGLAPFAPGVAARRCLPSFADLLTLKS